MREHVLNIYEGPFGLWAEARVHLRHPAIVRRRGRSSDWVTQRRRSDQLASFGTKHVADGGDRLA